MKRTTRRIRALGYAGVIIGWCCFTCAGQVTVPPPPTEAPPPTPPAAVQAPQKPRRPTARTAAPVIVMPRPTAPQVVTILHRLNGLKMFRLLLRSNKQIGAITKIDDTFKFTDDVHTNVIAGLALDDGQTIAAWLPDAEAEMAPPTIPLPPQAPLAPSGGGPTQAPRATTVVPKMSGPTGLFELPDVTVISRDGKRLEAKFIGMDGLTGLSVLKLSEKNFQLAHWTSDEPIGVGERLRLFAPEPVVSTETRAGGTIYVRVGEIQGKVTDVSRGRTGAIARVKIRAANLSAANIGGIAINDAGKTVGIVQAVESNEATLLPSALIRNAAKRVIDRQASVPRPWLGIRGVPVGKIAVEEILLEGWKREGAKALAEMQRGILLTSVAPGSPAAVAALRPGDVILRVNEEDIKSADDFSWLLEEAGPGGLVSFTIARPGKSGSEAVVLTLSESPDPFFGLRSPVEWSKAESLIKNAVKPGSLFKSLIAQGIETIELKSGAAASFGANAGLLVISVNPSAAAFKAGLRPGDVIETIDGHDVSSPSVSKAITVESGFSYSFEVVRNREKVVVTVVSSVSPR